MQLTLRTFYGPLALALVGLTSAARADFSVGQRVPSPTAINQSPQSTTYGAGFVWTPVTLPWLSNGSQTTFGGAIDTTSRVSVNPQGTSENGLTVKMPSGATGYALTVKSSAGSVVANFGPTGTLGLPGGDSSGNPGFHWLTVGTADNYGTNLGIGLDTAYNTVVNIGGTGFRVAAYNGAAYTPMAMNYIGQTAFGGAIDTGARLSVNPQATNENGMVVNMPSASTGYGLSVRGAGASVTGNTITSNGTSLVLQETGDTYGAASLSLQNRNGANGAVISNPSTGAATGVTDFILSNASGSQNIRLESRGTYAATGSSELQIGNVAGAVGGSGSLIVGNANVFINKPLQGLSASAVPVVVQGKLSQTADLLDITDSTNAVKASVNKNFVVTAKGYASSVRVVTAVDTATLTDSVLLCNGTFTETLPATGWPTGYRLTVKDTGTGTVTLTAGGTVTFDGATTLTFATQYKSRVLIFDGTNFQIESGLL